MLCWDSRHVNVRWRRCEWQMKISCFLAIFLENDRILFFHAVPKKTDFFPTVFGKVAEKNGLQFLGKLVICPQLPLPREHSLFESIREISHR